MAELRRRLIVVIAVFAAGTALSFFFSRDIFYLLQRPLASQLPASSAFITLSPVEGWLVYFKIAVVTSIVATSPVWLFQFWSFIAPGLRASERRAFLSVGMASAALFIGGALFCLFFIMPYGFRCLVSVLDGTDITLMPQISMYLSLVLRLVIAFGIVCELPLVTVVLSRWNIVPISTMKKARPYIYLCAFVIAAVITPPDVFTQIAVAIPFIVLFELSLAVARLTQKRLAGCCRNPS